MTPETRPNGVGKEMEGGPAPLPQDHGQAQ